MLYNITHSTFFTLISGFSCSCFIEWTGVTCEDNINECKHAVSPCLNGGLCMDTKGSHKYMCEPHWAVKNCDVDIIECDVTRCLNGGTCVKL